MGAASRLVFCLAIPHRLFALVQPVLRPAYQSGAWQPVQLAAHSPG